MALELDANYPRGLSIRKQILEEGLGSYPVSSAMLPTDLTFDEMMAHFIISPAQPRMQISNSRCILPLGHANMSYDVTTVSLTDLTFLGIGSTLLETYRNWSQNSGKNTRSPHYLCGQVQISFHSGFSLTAIEASGHVESNEAVAAHGCSSGDASASSKDAIKEGIEPEDGNIQGSKKRRNSELEDPRRTSKRVRSRVETEQQQNDFAYKDLRDVTNGLFPINFEFCECGERMVGDMDDFLNGFQNRMLAAGHDEGSQRIKGAHKDWVQLPHFGESPHAEDASDAVKNFCAIVSSFNSGLLDVIRQFLMWHLIGAVSVQCNYGFPYLENKWSASLHDVIVSLVLVLERHASWTSFLREAFPSAFGLQPVNEVAPLVASRRALIELLLSSAELICDSWLRESIEGHLSAFDLNEHEAEHEDDDNPLTWLTIPHILRRVCAAIAELLAHDDICAVASTISFYDGEISLASLDQKLAAADARIYVLEALEKFEESAYGHVAERLRPLFFVPVANERADTDAVRIAKSFIRRSCPFGVRHKLLNCLRMIVEAVGQCLAAMETIQEWTNALRQYKSYDTSFDTLFAEFVATVSVLMQLTWTYMKSHLELSSSSKKANAARRLKALNVLSIRSWVLMCYVLQAMNETSLSSAKRLSDHNDEVADSVGPRPSSCDNAPPERLQTASGLNAYAVTELLYIAHDELGKRGLCGMDDGRLLKFILRRTNIAGTDAGRAQIYQCYACLYDIRVEHANELSDHATAPLAFDQAAASDVFDTVSEQICALLAQKGGRGIPADIKQCLDKVSEIYKAPPWENAKVLFNKRAIEAFLDRPLNVLDMSPKTRSSLMCFDLSDEEKQRIPTVYFNLFFLQGRLAYAQYKARASQNYYVSTFYKTVDILEVAITYFSRAFHCFVQAKQLFSTEIRKPEIVASLWGEFGLLCHAISSNPMSGAAVMSNLHHIRAVWDKRLRASDTTKLPEDISINGFTEAANEHTAEPALLNKSNDVLRLGAYCFKKAASVKADWSYSYMLANIYAKLGSDPAAIIDHYRRAISLVPSEWSTKEQERILDPMVKLIGYLSKGLCRNELDSETVIAALTGLTDRANIYPKSGSAGLGHEAELDSRNRAIQSMTINLTHMKGLNVWHHKPTYRLAWLAYHEAKNPLQAQQILSTLFKLKDEKSKKFVNFWKPEFERPGKHFMSVHKYVVFLSKLMEENCDIDGLRRLCRKVRKADDVLLWPDRVWKAVYTACLGALQATASAADDASSHLMDVMSKSDFDLRAPDIERRIFAVGDRKSVQLQCLMCAHELRKLNDGLLDESMLERFLVRTYSTLFAEFFSDHSKDQHIYVGGTAPPSVEPELADAGVLTPQGDRTNAVPIVRVNLTDVLERIDHCCKNPPQIQQENGKTDVPIEDATHAIIITNGDSRTARGDAAEPSAGPEFLVDAGKGGTENG
ncbi:Histone transcription regulator 3 [Geranomyces michiganensis]|nr:Histone transcription regulator 3 [Geranomyces michiganensis]